MFVQFHENVLRHFFRSRPIPQKMARDAEDHPLVLPHERLEVQVGSHRHSCGSCILVRADPIGLSSPATARYVVRGSPGCNLFFRWGEGMKAPSGDGFAGEETNCDKDCQKAEGPLGSGPSRGESSKANARMAKKPFYNRQSKRRRQIKSSGKGAQR